MTEEQSKMLCITCPKGCTLTVNHSGATVLKVEGGGCKRGADYAAAELTDPRRMVASTVRVSGGAHPLLPVYTCKPFPKPRIPNLLAALRQLELHAPVSMGQVVLADALGTGIDVIASRNMGEKDDGEGWNNKE
jgi:CxxC motif-containing protein